MKTIDFGAVVVIYNFIIGLLLMISSEKIGSYAGRLISGHRETTARLTRLGVLAFGACVSILSASIYFFVYLLKIGV